MPLESACSNEFYMTGQAVRSTETTRSKTVVHCLGIFRQIQLDVAVFNGGWLQLSPMVTTVALVYCRRSRWLPLFTVTAVAHGDCHRSRWLPPFTVTAAVHGDCRRSRWLPPLTVTVHVSTQLSRSTAIQLPILCENLLTSPKMFYPMLATIDWHVS